MNRNFHGKKQGGGGGGHGGGGHGGGGGGGRHHNRHKKFNRDRDRDRDNRDRGGQQRERLISDDEIKMRKRGEPKVYGFLQYETHNEARNDIQNIMEKAKTVGQLNVIIKAEGDQFDPEISKFAKIFAGAAWFLIHTRRVEEGWYNSPH